MTNYLNIVSVRQIISFTIPERGNITGMVEAILRGGAYIDSKTKKKMTGSPENPLVVIRKYQWGQPTKTMEAFDMKTVEKYLSKKWATHEPESHPNDFLALSKAD